MIEDDPDLPPAEALIVVVPAFTAVTRPSWETVATDAFDEDHVNDGAEPGGFAVALSWTVDPIATVALDGETEIDLNLLG